MADVATVTPIVALDVSSTGAALELVETLGDLCDFYKVGGELFTNEGPSVVRTLRQRSVSVFLDLKFHDIPNTVRRAVESAASLGVRLMTVHAAGGAAMLEAAAAGARDTECDVLAVTILTSLSGEALARAWGRPVTNMQDEVVRLAGLAADAGLHGVVCAGSEAPAVRSAYGSRLATLVPGVRLPGDATQDQARVVTPRGAADAGARYVVVGRAVTAAISPRDAMKQVRALLQFDPAKDWDRK
jgi:orotidine-5'-phosphate decarboxylase